MEIQVHGAGVLGLSAALALAEAGHDVALSDPHGIGTGASAKAAGIVSTMTWNDDDFHLVQETRGRLGQLIAEASFDVPAAAGLWRSRDSLTIASASQSGPLDDVQHRLERLGEEPERLGGLDAAAAYPSLHIAPNEHVLVAQEDGYVEAGDLCAVLAWACEEEGVAMQLGKAVAVGGAEKDVIAAGAWSPKLVREAGGRLPMEAFRVQAASIQWPGHETPIVHDVANESYFRPESDASLMAGNGTRLLPHDPEDYNEAADAEFKESIAQKLVRRIRGDGQWRRGWAGLVVGTPDRHPLCGRVPDQDDLFVLTGDNGYGVMRCVALGNRLAAAVAGDEHVLTSPSRYAEFDEAWELREGFGW